MAMSNDFVEIGMYFLFLMIGDVGIMGRAFENPVPLFRGENGRGSTSSTWVVRT